jgi:alanine-glyoxylate transaminase/serine-glyoxylate transaminase/serine-pyruvate transaminase
MTVPVAEHIEQFNPPRRLLLGPGPSTVHPRVLRALGLPLIGHLDPAFLEMMDEIQGMLRRVFTTANRFTIALSGTGSAGMEAALVNFIEAGDAVVVGVNGTFGGRMADIVERSGGRAVRLERPWGGIIEPDAIEEALRRHAPVKAVALVHAETSTGALQPLEDAAAICRRHGALLIVDAVTSLGGHRVAVDDWGIDVCYSATQKCLSCPPGLAPLTLSDRAVEVLRRRPRPCRSWYLDLAMIADYWAESKRTYHHTAPISMLYGLREALRLVLEEGLDARFARHRRASRALLAGLETLGLAPLAEAGHRLATLNCVTLPPQVEDRTVRGALLAEHGIEIGGGLGPLQGKVWRIGLMGESASLEHVRAVLEALEAIFVGRGWTGRRGQALAAADAAAGREAA